MKDHESEAADDIPPESGDVVDALRAPGTAEELGDEGHYLDAFDVYGPPAGRWSGSGPDPQRDGPVRTIRLTAPVAVAAAVVLVAGVSVAAAYTGTLPRGLQSSAHRYLGAQAPPAQSGRSASAPSTGPLGSSSVSASQRATTTGTPTVSGSASPSDLKAAQRLCASWSNGSLPTTSASYERLQDLAGRLSVSVYCGSVLAEASTSTTSPASPTTGSSSSKPSHGPGKKDTPPGQQKKAGQPTPPGQQKAKAGKPTPPGQLKTKPAKPPKPPHATGDHA